MDVKKILDIIEQGEGLDAEFKESRNALNKDVYETICAFLNRNGGHILLGVRDDGVITGNPKIASFFREIGRADKLGSGVRKIFRYTPIYSGGKRPELIEGDIFRIVIPLRPKVEAVSPGTGITTRDENAPVNASENAPVNASVKLSITQQMIMREIRRDRTITYDELAEKLGKNRATIARNISKLKEFGLLRRIGPDKGGYWEVVE